MSLYQGYFGERFGLDPSGTQVKKTPDPDKEWPLDDGQKAQQKSKEGKKLNKSDKEYINLMQNIQKLKERSCPTLNFFYLTEPNDGSNYYEMEDFLKEAPKKECNVNIYWGHGVGRSLKKNEGELGYGDRYWRKDIDGQQTDSVANEGTVKLVKGVQSPPVVCKSTKYGFLSCYASTFNNALGDNYFDVGGKYKDNKLMKYTVIWPSLAKSFNKSFDKINKQLDEMCKCCNGKVNLNIYFSSK